MATCRNLFFFPFLCLTLFLVSTVAFSQVSPTEREALIDLYHATDGDDWHRNDGWLGEPGSECDWHGMNCLGEAADDAHVFSLNLSDNGLSGELPDTLAGLDRLRVIQLDHNGITGRIPPSLAELTELSDMDLGNNGFDGPVPGELLISPAHSINLEGNQLNGYTEAPVASTAVRKGIRLTGNPISSLPPASWRDTGVISRLDLDRTELAGELDFGFHPWPELEHLVLDDNALTALGGIDPATLIDLRRLFLSGNRLKDSWPVDGTTLPELRLLDLSGNGLETPPPANLPGHPGLQELRLGRNELVGTGLEPLLILPGLRSLELSHNPLGALPADLPGDVAAMLRLGLSTTGLEGGPPAWFSDLALRDLNLSGNHLGSDLEPWLAALSTEERVRLDLSRNQFQGPLPASLTEIDFEHNTSGTAFGLNLCWNRFDQAIDAELEEFLAEVHFGGSLADCNDRELVDIDPTISGSWYNPDRDGKGYNLMMLDNGQLLHYWFGYPYPVDANFEEQMWSLQIVAPEAAAAIHPPSLVPFGGRFGHGLGNGDLTTYGHRELEMVRLGKDTLNILASWGASGRYIIVSPPPPAVQERFDYQRLTELAGTTCDNQSPFQGFSGAWYNPEAEGEGFIVEVQPDARALVYWFTYAPDDSGRQAWMIGDGHFDESPIDDSGASIGVPPPPPPDAVVARIEIDPLMQPVGSVLGPDFDSEAVERVEWGSLALEFHADGTGHVSWDSTFEDFGSGGYAIERLARPMLAECD